MFIDYLHGFVIDHINCYYFPLMPYSIGENQSCEAKGKIRQSQPLVGQDDYCHEIEGEIQCSGSRLSPQFVFVW